MTAPVCDEVFCDQLATWWLSAAWTAVDFGEWYACDEHLAPAAHYLVERTVDGHPPIYVQSYPILEDDDTP